MPLQSSGEITLAQIGTEFGDSQPHSLSEFYAGGSAGVTSGGAPNVPSSGAISISQFYSAANQVTVTRSSSGTNINLSSEFGSNWTSAIPKIYVINSGVTIGGTGGNAALTVNSSMGGTLIINTAGSIEGHHGTNGAGGAGGHFGGNANGSNGGNGTDGGTAILVQSGSPTINNTGSIRGGGGGGGGGGGSSRGTYYHYGTRAAQGAAGGAGGTGQGYNQSQSNGSSGSTGSGYQNYGGNGGNGGTFGNAGGNGGNGNFGSTALGSQGTGGTGGAAGAAITGTSRTLNNSGTINGAT